MYFIHMPWALIYELMLTFAINKFIILSIEKQRRRKKKKKKKEQTCSDHRRCHGGSGGGGPGVRGDTGPDAARAAHPRLLPPGHVGSKNARRRATENAQEQEQEEEEKEEGKIRKKEDKGKKLLYFL